MGSVVGWWESRGDIHGSSGKCTITQILAEPKVQTTRVKQWSCC
jgi:hypothetical protein